jgi:hypothetical protein
VISPSQGPLTYTTQQTDLHALSGIRNTDPSSQAAVELRLTSHGYRNLSYISYFGSLYEEHGHGLYEYHCFTV